jgi:hypothetical protein
VYVDVEYGSVDVDGMGIGNIVHPSQFVKFFAKDLDVVWDIARVMRKYIHIN